MEYKIVMPVLSDTMDKGKLIKWHVKENDRVKKGDVIAEVESDKAIMEVQTFKDGVVKKLLAKEGDEIEVKKPIAIIETDTKEAENKKEQEEKPKERVQKNNLKETKEEISIFEDILPANKPKIAKTKAAASPAAKKEALKINLDIESLQKEGKIPTPAHLKDIKETELKKYFTPKALKLIKEYQIDINSFKLNKKYKEEDIKNFIKENNIPKISPLSSNQKAVIQNLKNSLQKPIFHIYETIEIGFDIKFKFTAYFLKILAKVMQNHPKTRAVLKQNSLQIYPSSNISVALAKDNELYMAVIKKAEDKSLNQIEEWLKEIKTKKLSKEDMEGSTFGVSNLGMFKIEAFDAIINKDDSAIAAIGEIKENRFKTIFTFDHRILNGKDAALFVKELKEAFLEGRYV